MDEQSKAELDRILSVEPAALTESDAAFLRARSSYLSEEQRHVYAEVLAEAPASEESEAEQPKARKSRRASEESEA